MQDKVKDFLRQVQELFCLRKHVILDLSQRQPFCLSVKS